MSDYNTYITINIALEVANDPICETPHPPETALELVFCEKWKSCTNPRCYVHGCLNALRKQGNKGVNHEL